MRAGGCRRHSTALSAPTLFLCFLLATNNIQQCAAPARSRSGTPVGSEHDAGLHDAVGSHSTHTGGQNRSEPKEDLHMYGAISFESIGIDKADADKAAVDDEYKGLIQARIAAEKYAQSEHYKSKVERDKDRAAKRAEHAKHVLNQKLYNIAPDVVATFTRRGTEEEARWRITKL